mmetsp:Transcript_11601/g.43285  ORF Transcript_11601/g.43285 Transcript_11601/m.43285 type:complete len:204 (-) Transcript_11601:1282-1893(-)
MDTSFSSRAVGCDEPTQHTSTGDHHTVEESHDCGPVRKHAGDDVLRDGFKAVAASPAAAGHARHDAGPRLPFVQSGEHWSSRTPRRVSAARVGARCRHSFHDSAVGRDPAVAASTGVSVEVEAGGDQDTVRGAGHGTVKLHESPMQRRPLLRRRFGGFCKGLGRSRISDLAADLSRFEKRGRVLVRPFPIVQNFRGHVHRRSA